MNTATHPGIARPVPLAGISGADLAATLLRVSMGVLFLAHAMRKYPFWSR